MVRASFGRWAMSSIALCLLGSCVLPEATVDETSDGGGGGFGGGVSLAPLGSVCSDNNQCLSGLCVNGGSGTGWCSRTCTFQSDCPNEPLMVCDENTSGAEICWVSCYFPSDCAKYGANVSCVEADPFTVCAVSGP